MIGSSARARTVRKIRGAAVRKCRCRLQPAHGGL